MESLESIERSLDNLEETLAPLLDKPLSETAAHFDLLQTAKLQVLLPYVVNDLIFIYLRTRGLNPKAHPVVGELDRVKQYFDKIKKAEDPEKRKFVVDQDAATRFIKHAIKESQAVQEHAQRETKQSTHTRFTNVSIAGANTSAAALAKIQARNHEHSSEESSSEESELEVFEAAANIKEDNEAEADGKGKGKSKGKGREVATSMETPTGKKRRRNMDPWAGYGQTQASTPAEAEVLDELQRKKPKRSQNLTPDAQKDRPRIDTSMLEREIGRGGVVQAETAELPVKRGKRKTKPTMESTDVDKISEPINVLAKEVLQDIDTAVTDSSRSSTPAQGKSKKKRAKRQKSDV